MRPHPELPQQDDWGRGLFRGLQSPPGWTLIPTDNYAPTDALDERAQKFT